MREDEFERDACRSLPPCGEGYGMGVLQDRASPMPTTPTLYPSPQGGGKAQTSRLRRCHRALPSRADTYRTPRSWRGLHLVPQVRALQWVLDRVQPDQLVTLVGAGAGDHGVAEARALGQERADLLLQHEVHPFFGCSRVLDAAGHRPIVEPG